MAAASCVKMRQTRQKIEHYGELSRWITDQKTIEQIGLFIEKLRAEKAALHPRSKFQAVDRSRSNTSKDIETDRIGLVGLRCLSRGRSRCRPIDCTKLRDADRIADPPVVVECASDAEIIEKAKPLLDGLDIEIWEGTRGVARLPATHPK